MAQASRKSDSSLSSTLLHHAKHGLQESAFVLLIGAAAFLLMALISYHMSDPAWTHTGGGGAVRNYGGIIGALGADILLYFFGYAAYLLPPALVLLAWRITDAQPLMLDGEVVLFRVLGIGVTLTAACGLTALFVEPVSTAASGGGIIGIGVSRVLTKGFGIIGGSGFLLMLFVAGFTLATGFSWASILDVLGRLALKVGAIIATQTIHVPARLAHLWQHWRRSAVQEPSPEGATTAPQPRAVEPVAPIPTSAPEPVAGAAPEPELEPLTFGGSGHGRRERIEPVVGVQSDRDSAQAAASRGGIVADDELEDDVLVAEEEVVARSGEPTTPLSARQPALLRTVDSLASKDATAEFDGAAVVRVERSQKRPSVPAPRATEEYPLPPLELLDAVAAEEEGYSSEDLEVMSRRLEKLLRDFGVEVKVVGIEPGPVITRFEVEPAPGVKVSQISNLAKDLARGLSVMSVRVVEVIPGKSVMGLEIPNQRRQIVYLSEILTSPVYQTASASLTLSLGKDIGGRPVVANLAKMPHLLVAGTTGSGKSVAINAMLLSMLYKATPEQVRLILIDPKMLELSVYEDIPHLLAPVVTDMKEAANALRWCVAEMERRYRLMAALKVRNVAGFNRQVKAAVEAGEPLADPLYKPAETGLDEVPPLLQPLPMIVVVIDELADMMMIVGKKVEELIARLAQKARASGIHLILATQRPSVDVITGLIKANIPTRIAFQVSSKVDSRTILDQSGAENLLGHGDMLFQPPGSGIPQRVHGAFVDDHEVNRVVEYLKQVGSPDYIEDILQEPVDVPESVAAFIGGGDSSSDIDPLYDQAVRIVTETRKASISGVQRRLKIGYNRAARMIEEMESAGIVGALQPNGSREVLAPPPPEV